MVKIAHFGTFDVDNYGDLLFPHIVEYRLPQYDWEHISPTNNMTVFNDSLPVISNEVALKRRYKAIVIGGGNIIHLNHNRNTVYNNKDGFAYASLWVGAAKMAMEQNIPYIFNSPGVSKRFIHRTHKTIAYYTFRNSNYLAFRERFSIELIKSINGAKSSDKLICQIVPDTAFEIDKMWPLQAEKLPDYICVNLNERYHNPIGLTAKCLDKISVELGLSIKFVIIGDCHGDYDFTKQVSLKMKSEHEIVKSDGLKKIAHVIGYSSYFLGSSMHGFITALSYGVPAFLILNKSPLHKFKGLLEITGIDNNIICESFDEVLKKLGSPAILRSEVKQNIQKELDLHWEKIDRIIKNGDVIGSSRTVSAFQLLLKMQVTYNKICNKMKI